MKSKNVEINEHKSGFYTISIDGKMVKNPRLCPQGAATFGSKKDATQYLESEGIISC